MKREIKFRAILKKEKTIRDVYGIDYLNGLVLVYISCDYEWLPYSKLIQFTGLQDKNGKDIYEGYVINVYVENNIYRRWENRIVFYCNGSFGINDTVIKIIGNNVEDKFTPLSNLDLEILEIEVIGNIYENPELIK